MLSRDAQGGLGSKAYCALSLGREVGQAGYRPLWASVSASPPRGQSRCDEVYKTLVIQKTL